MHTPDDDNLIQYSIILLKSKINKEHNLAIIAFYVDPKSKSKREKTLIQEILLGVIQETIKRHSNIIKLKALNQNDSFIRADARTLQGTH